MVHMPLANEKLKVLVITPTLECGGAERYVSLLCNIAKHDIDLSILVVNNKNPFFEIPASVNVTDLGIEKVRAAFGPIKKHIAEVKPHIVYSTANHLNLLLAIFKFRLPKEIILLARETSIVSINSKNARFPKLYSILLKAFYRNIDHIICQSEFMQHDLIVNYSIEKEKTTVIYNAVDPALEYCNRSRQKHAFLSVARLSAEKGIDRILRTLAKLQMPYTYLIVGDGPEYNKLQQLTAELSLKDKVTFAGEKRDPLVDYGDHDLFLMASFHEGFPNAVLEANSVGMPVVAINAPGGINEIIIDGKNGFIAQDEAGFRDTIVRASAFPFDRSKISEAARSKFSLNTMLENTSQLFRRLYALNK